MRRVIITRTETDKAGTFGHLVAAPEFESWSLELPWKKNLKNKSCIPAGIYECEWSKSPKFGDCYHIKNVPGREFVLFHSGNWAGDEDAGLKSNSDGCILLGRAIGEIAGQKALLSSRDAISAFNDAMDKEPFELVIRWADGLAKSLAA